HTATAGSNSHPAPWPITPLALHPITAAASRDALAAIPAAAIESESSPHTNTQARSGRAPPSSSRAPVAAVRAASVRSPVRPTSVNPLPKRIACLLAVTRNPPGILPTRTHEHDSRVGTYGADMPSLSPQSRPTARTVGELRAAGHQHRTLKAELRANLLEA